MLEERSGARRLDDGGGHRGVNGCAAPGVKLEARKGAKNNCEMKCKVGGTCTHARQAGRIMWRRMWPRGA